MMSATQRVGSSRLSVATGQSWQCRVCSHYCTLRPGQRGRCRVRQGTHDGVGPVQGQGIAAVGVARVEAHPFFHFHPGSRTFGVGAVGCTATCAYCQNWELALAPLVAAEWQIHTLYSSAALVVQAALERRCFAVAFTYNEATVWIEAMLDIAAAAREAELKVILVTNGYLSSESWELLAPLLDAVKLDLKAPDETTYQRLTGLSLAPVLESLRFLSRRGIWCEVSTVVVPDLLDTDQAIQQMASLIYDASGNHTPWHLLRFFPAYQMDHVGPGSLATLRRLRRVAREAGLLFPYISNVANIDERNSYCPICSELLADRRSAGQAALVSACPQCGSAIAGVALAC